MRKDNGHNWTRSNACAFYLTEVGKNINQDKTLAIQRYVEGYHELVSQMATHLENHEPEDHDDHGDHEKVLQYSAKQGEMPQQIYKLYKD